MINTQYKKIIPIVLFFFLIGTVLIVLSSRSSDISMSQMMPASVIVAQSNVDLNKENSVATLKAEYYEVQKKVGDEQAKIDLATKKNASYSSSAFEVYVERANLILEEIKKKGSASDIDEVAANGRITRDNSYINSISTMPIEDQGLLSQNAASASSNISSTNAATALKSQIDSGQDSTFGKKSYVPLSVIPGLTNSGNSTVTLKPFLKLMFKWGIAIAVILSIIMITIGGFQYMTTDAVFSKSEGRAKINAAIIGLLLALSAWLILQTVDPRILQEPQSAILN